jgi:transaldolase/glucose-6-phosphate isomerase
MDIKEYNLGTYQERVDRRLAEWTRLQFLSRLWQKDPTLWAPLPTPELSDRLGWLELPHTMIEHLKDLHAFAGQIRSEGFTTVALLGMGGSSLAPEVFQKVLGNAPGFPELQVLDSTHPDEIARIENQLDLSRVLFVVSSKSGTTLETLSLFAYFWNKVESLGRTAGLSFVAVTDPGSQLEALASQRGFRRIFLAPQDVGGRFSALSSFGLLPAALIGVNLTHLMASASGAARKNGAVCNKTFAPGLVLGAAIGEIALDRDKFTFITSPGLGSLPSWLEQLIAESTGKDGKGIVPVVDEPFPKSGHYGNDRCFVILALAEEVDPRLEDLYISLLRAGHPVLTRILEHRGKLAAEMYHWEVAVSAASAILGVHPFNQPDVQLTKAFVQRVMQAAKEEGRAAKLDPSVPAQDSSEPWEPQLLNWMQNIQTDSYISLQAYLPRLSDIQDNLLSLRQAFLDLTGKATTLGFGPRFLHSTGQLHKGGPKNGLFLQLTDTPVEDKPVPERDYSFRRLIQAQALGDYQALAQGNHPVLRINLGSEAANGLKDLEKLVKRIP